MFMPVGTSASVKGVTVGQLNDLGSQVVLANTYHLSLRPGADVWLGRREKVKPFHELRRLHAPADSAGSRCSAWPTRSSWTTRASRSAPSTTARRCAGRPRATWRSSSWAPTSPCSSTNARLPGEGLRGEGRGPVGQLGASLPGRAHPARPDAVRHRAGRHDDLRLESVRRLREIGRGPGARRRHSAVSASGAIRWARTTR